MAPRRIKRQPDVTINLIPVQPFSPASSKNALSQQNLIGATPQIIPFQLKWSRLIVLAAAVMSSAAVAGGGVQLKGGHLQLASTLAKKFATVGRTEPSSPEEEFQEPEWPSALSNSTASIILEMWSQDASEVSDDDYTPRPAVLPEPEHDQSVVLTREELKRATRRRGKGYKARRSRLMRESLRKLTGERQLERRKRARPNRCTNEDLVWPASLSPFSSSSSSSPSSSSTTATDSSRGDGRHGGGGDAGVVKPVDIPSRCVELDLYDQSLTDAHARSLAASLASVEQPSKVQWLDLTRNAFGPDAGACLGAALPFNTALTYLNLNSNSLGPAGATALAKGLSTIPEVGVNVSGKTLLARHCSRLEVLVLHNNAIGDVGAEALAEALGKEGAGGGRYLKRLMLTNNEIGDQGASALARALKLRQQHDDDEQLENVRGEDEEEGGGGGGLQVLDLNSNRVGDEGAMAIGEALAHTLSLEELYLSGQTTKKVARPLQTFLPNAHSGHVPRKSIMLAKKSSSTAVDSALTLSVASTTVSSSSLGDAGALALANGLEANPRLSTLFLTGNNVGQVGAEALLECLETTALGVLGLDRNSGGITETQLSKVQRLTAF